MADGDAPDSPEISPDSPEISPDSPEISPTLRIEHDSQGEVEVPAAALWGAQTERARRNFPVSGETMPREVLVALAEIKRAAAWANAELGSLPESVAEAIALSAGEVIDGYHDDQFPVDVFQTGSGTSTNMNMNEVLAHLASEKAGRPISPNDEVNCGQSSNDTFPTAIQIALAASLTSRLLPALADLSATLVDKARALAPVIKAGRTHLMDAVPMTLGQEFGAFATQVNKASSRIAATLTDLLEVPLGGTAVGTGLNAHPDFAALTLSYLSRSTGLDLKEAPDHFEAQASRDGVVATSAAMRGLAVTLIKIANDLRLLGSGPAAGLAEITLPALQPGSSIMPGKVNPVIPEMVMQVGAAVIGHDATVAFAGASGNLQLNVMMPAMARATLESSRLLASAAGLLAEKCIAGLVADEARCRRYALSSSAIVTALNPLIGYEAAAELVKRAAASGQDLIELAVSSRLAGEGAIRAALDLERMAHPHRRPAHPTGVTSQVE